MHECTKSYLWSDKECIGVLQKTALRFGGIWFVVNPYDPCVANKLIHDSQMMVVWPVDDLKVSHKTQIKSQS